MDKLPVVSDYEEERVRYHTADIRYDHDNYVEYIGARHSYTEYAMSTEFNVMVDIDLIIPDTVDQYDLKLFLFNANPKIFNYILSHTDVISNSLFYDDSEYQAKNVHWLKHNIIAAFKYGIAVKYSTIHNVLISMIESLVKDIYRTNIVLHPEILDADLFSFLLDQLIDSGPTTIIIDYMYSLIWTLASSMQITLLDALLFKIRERIPRFNRDELNLKTLRKSISDSANFNQNLAPYIIETLLILDYYGIHLADDSKSGNKFRNAMLNSEVKDLFQEYLEGAYGMYYPPSIKKIVVPIELIRKTPGNVMHLLPIEVAEHVYAYL